jgi:hypothetical protein
MSFASYRKPKYFHTKAWFVITLLMLLAATFNAQAQQNKMKVRI